MGKFIPVAPSVRRMALCHVCVHAFVCVYNIRAVKIDGECLDKGRETWWGDVEA